MPRQRSGAHAVEFALILPVWLLVVFAIMDFGWMYFHVAVLDTAATIGCRAGSLIDPGDADEHIADIERRTMERMREVLVAFGAGTCDTCTVAAYTTGAPPARTLVCTVSRRVDPLTAMILDPRMLQSVQVSRLEWQREAAP